DVRSVNPRVRGKEPLLESEHEACHPPYHVIGLPYHELAELRGDVQPPRHRGGTSTWDDLIQVDHPTLRNSDELTRHYENVAVHELRADEPVDPPARVERSAP